MCFPYHLSELLHAQSAEFRDVWSEHEVGIHPGEVKHFIHPELGALELTWQTLLDPGITFPARLHRHSRQREIREAATALRHRHPGASLSRLRKLTTPVAHARAAPNDA
jgi:hypothetical protein